MVNTMMTGKALTVPVETSVIDCVRVAMTILHHSQCCCHPLIYPYHSGPSHKYYDLSLEQELLNCRSVVASLKVVEYVTLTI